MGSFLNSGPGGGLPNPLSSGSLGIQNGFVATGAPIQGQNFTGELSNAQGNFNQAFGNESNLATALQGEMTGAGPNPAMLEAQQMNENAIKSNAGTVASMKGISPALAQRMAAQNAATMQQGAANQGAITQANQQLAVQNALGNLYGSQANQSMGQQSTLQNALAAYNNANVGMQSNLNNTNQATSAQNAATNAGLIGGAMQGVSGLMSLSKGGVVPNQKPAVKGYDMGGPVTPAPAMGNWGFNDMAPVDNDAVMGMTSQYINAGGKALDQGLSSVGENLSLSKLMGSGGGGEQDGQQMAGGAGDAGGITGGGMMSPGAEMGGGEGGGLALLALASKGGEINDHMTHMAKIYHPNFKGNAKLKSAGGKVPGQAKVKGDSSKNDTVPTMLSPGEIVLPRSVTQSKDPVKAAADFVAEKLREKQGSGNHTADFHDALANAIKTRRAK